MQYMEWLMITLQALCAHLDEILQPHLYSDVCPNGLQVEGRHSIRRAATAVSASLATIEAAEAADVDALIVHHGLFWQREPLTVVGTKRRKLQLLLERGISLIAYHLPLDGHHQYGNNWRAACDLGWTALEPFGQFGTASIGVKGSFPPIERAALQRSLEQYYGQLAHCAPGGKELVSTAAIISGGAHKCILEAAASGVDCFITGSFDEPVWHQAFEEKINFYALGHSCTERIGPRAIAVHLEEHFDLPCDFIDIANPF
jgi:dinuclear metal center YbgI/SA1388 family protein